MRLVCVGLALAFGCGSDPGGGGDDAPPADSGPHDMCILDPASCLSDSGTFVSEAKGSDTNPGSKAMPFKTITAGIAHAKSLGGEQSVYVAQGMYPEKVTLSEGIDLHGGYECSASACSWTRDIATFVTTIVNQDFEGVLAGSAITPATLIGGFTIVGKDGVPPTAPGSVALTVAAGSPTIRGNKIRGGNVTGGGASSADRSVGVAVRGSGAMAVVIENNEVIAGTGVGASIGLTLEQVGTVSSLATVSSNVLRSGTARRSLGISAFGARQGTIVSDNDISAGNSTNGATIGIEVTSRMTIDRNRINVDNATGACTTPTQWCSGISSASATLVITNNVIYGPTGNRSAGVFLTEAGQPAGQVVVNGNWIGGYGNPGNPTGTTRTESAAIVVSITNCNNCGFVGMVGRVRNNILDGGVSQNRYGVREDPAQGRTTRVELLENNDIWFAPNFLNRNDVLYREVSSGGTPTDYKSLSFLEGGFDPPAQNNLNVDPMIDSTFHLLPGSPCVNKGVATEAPLKDLDGEARPAQGAVDIGPDERP